MQLPKKLRIRKLHELMELEGYEAGELMEFLELYAHDSVVPGICADPACSYTTSVEPDQDRGWCEECGKGTVVSVLILAGVY